MIGILIRRGRDTRDACAQKDNHVRTKQQEGCHLQAKEKGLRGSQPCCHLDLGLSVSTNARKQIYVV